MLEVEKTSSNQVGATPDTTNAVIEVQNLTKTYPGNVEAVKGINFQISEGEFFGFLGPNGAGKSTTIKILITLLARSGGEVKILGHDVEKDADTVRRLIGYAAQEASTDDDLTGRENLDIQGNLYGLSGANIKQRSQELLELMDLTEGGAADRKVGTYSGGMRKRLDLATALIHRPRVLFLDEPTTGLDPQNRAGLWRYLERLNKQEGLTIFLTTHYMEEADRLCQRLAIIDHGTIIAEGSPAELKSSLGGDVITLGFKDSSTTAEEQAGKAKELLQGLPFVRDLTLGTGATLGHLAVVVQNGGESVPPVMRSLDNAGIIVSSLTLTSPSLDDVFLKFTGERIRQDDPVAYSAGSGRGGPFGRRPRRP